MRFFKEKGVGKSRGGKDARIKSGKALPLLVVAEEEEPVERSRKEKLASQGKTQGSPILEVEGEIGFLVEANKRESEDKTSSWSKTKDLLKFLALGHCRCLQRTFLMGC